MKSQSIAIHILAGLVAIPSALAGFLMLLVAILFAGNFNTGNPWHTFVFMFTLAAPFLALTGYVLYLRRQTWQALAWTMAGSASFGITLLLWSAPLSNGIIH